MDIQLHTSESVSVIELSGRLDSYTVPKFKKELSSLAGARPLQIIVDLTDVTFMDSRALAAIIKGMHDCRSTGGDLCLSGPNKSVRRILELTRLDKAINIYSNKSEALASYNS